MVLGMNAEVAEVTTAVEKNTNGLVLVCVCIFFLFLFRIL